MLLGMISNERLDCRRAPRRGAGVQPSAVRAVLADDAEAQLRRVLAPTQVWRWWPPRALRAEAKRFALEDGAALVRCRG